MSTTFDFGWHLDPVRRESNSFQFFAEQCTNLTHTLRIQSAAVDIDHLFEEIHGFGIVRIDDLLNLPLNFVESRLH